MRGLNLFCLMAILCFSQPLFSQTVYTITADSVKLTSCDSSELIIQNHTQNVPGFLFNTGNGRTIFKHALQPIGGGSFLVGADTLNLATNAWVQGGNAWGATGILGTTDNNNLDFYTNNTYRGRFTATGGLLLGTTANQFNDALVVWGTASFANGILVNYGDLATSRIYAGGGLQLQGNAATGSQIYMEDRIGAGFTGPSVVSMGCNFSTLGAGQDILQITGNGGGPVAYFGANGNTLLGSATDNGQTLQVNGSSYFNGTQQITGNFTLPSTGSFSTFNPTINAYTGDYYGGSVSVITPTITANGNYQALYGLTVAPTYNLNGYVQHTDNVSAALHVATSLGGIRIDQGSSVPGNYNTGQPLFIYQAGTAVDKEAIYNDRSGTATVRSFIWDRDERSSSTMNVIVPALRSTVNPAIQTGGGVSFSLDRYYYGTEASIDMHYDATPDSTANVLTAIGFHTTISGYGQLTPLYVTGANVGVGTTSPTANFHTNGTVRFAGLTPDSTQTNVLVTDANGNLYYRSASSLAADNPIRSSLAVNGTIKSHKIIISPDEWADYVFDSAYRLPNLEDVESYIHREHHLPGVPTAAAVQQDSLDVGASQAALLKKIEELTLYTIEQKKEIDSIKAQLQEVKKLIADKIK